MADERKPFAIAVGLLRRTTPFLLLNVVVYGGFFLLILAWLAVFGGLAAFLAPRIEVLAFLFLLIAIGGPGALVALARRYLLYLVQGAHIAVATTLLFDGALPEGQGQVAYGRAQVQSRFRDVSVLFAVDRAVHGVVRAFTRQFVRIAEMLPLGEAFGQVARVGASIVNRSVSYVDEAILSYAIARDEPNVWRSARHGVILYAQAYKPILGAAVRIWLLGRVAFLALLLVLGIPGFLLLLTFDAIWFQAVVLAAVVMLAWLIIAATYEPFALIYSLVTYHQAIEGVEVNAVWDQRLQQVSRRFKEIVGKAREGGGSDPLDTAPVPPETAELEGGGGQGAVPSAGTSGGQGAVPSAGASGGQGAVPSAGASGGQGAVPSAGASGGQGAVPSAGASGGQGAVPSAGASGGQGA
ncbi:MAG: hypothetical protein ACLFV0_03930, partial [Nitriliruptoraceae bacterium]